MNNSGENLSSYFDARVFLAPSAELVIALPVYADQTEALFEAEVVSNMTQTNNNLSFRVAEQIGYIIYHPEIGTSIFIRELPKFMEDLGKLNS